jgi:hypothetical protein
MSQIVHNIVRPSLLSIAAVASLSAQSIFAQEVPIIKLGALC